MIITTSIQCVEMEMILKINYLYEYRNRTLINQLGLGKKIHVILYSTEEWNKLKKNHQALY